MADWQYGRCECCNNPSDCLLAFCCPNIFAAITSDEAGQGVIVAALQCLYYPLLVPFLRNEVREEKGIQGSVLGDILLGWFLPCCTMIQIRNELD